MSLSVMLDNSKSMLESHDSCMHGLAQGVVRRGARDVCKLVDIIVCVTLIQSLFVIAATISFVLLMPI